MSADMFKLVLTKAADAFGRGSEYGVQAAEEVHRCIETYKAHLAQVGNMSWSEAKAEARRYLPFVIAALPAETEMLRGLAAGADVDFGDIMVLNTRYEILHYPKNECTTYAILREASSDGKVYIGQNWDQRPFVREHVVVLHMTMEDGTKIMGVTEAGQLPRNGMNSHGIGLVASSLNSSLDGRVVGMPGNFTRMRVLRSRSFDEAREVLTAYQRSVANNYCLASAHENRAADIEAIPTMPCLINPEKGIVAHANHILSRPELDTSKGKKFRGERLCELFLKRAGDISADYIAQSVSDHMGFPDSVCSHMDDSAVDMHRQWMTIASMIYNLDDLELDICCGNPCEGEFKKLRIADY
jgi:isopenicillin-N N-acyltransferase-like protein